VAERVAIVGSREGADLDHVESFVRELWNRHPGTILVSGGARGVDTVAEKLWLSFGGRVESYRPVKKGESWAVEKWELGGEQPRVYLLVNEPTWENYKSAATYRDILIADAADRVIAFMRSGGSRGAGFTATMGEAYDKYVRRYEARRAAA
jgi:hypothetical protein